MDVVNRVKIRIKKTWAGISAVTLTILVVSCVTEYNERQAFAPPSIPGAKFIGSEECAICHDEISEGFAHATHAKLIDTGQNALNLGCEACHGPGSIHSDTGGAFHTIINPQDSPETCFQCHLDKRGEFGLPHHHPVMEGMISCTDCHDPHEGQAIKGGGVALLTESQTCFQCHSAQKGPFAFEHEAIREGCTSCHSPHGSVNEKMLKMRNANLCLQCHFQQQTSSGEILIGGRNHNNFLNRGTCWTAGCHEAVHGSHVNSSLRF